jgi:hypothetical protein
MYLPVFGISRHLQFAATLILQLRAQHFGNCREAMQSYSLVFFLRGFSFGMHSNTLSLVPLWRRYFSIGSPLRARLLVFQSFLLLRLMEQVNQRLGIVSTRILMKLKGNPSVHTKVNCNVLIFFLYSFLCVALYVYLFFS